MVRQNSVEGHAVTVRRSRRIAGRRRSEIAESSKMGERNNQENQVHHPIQRVLEPEENQVRHPIQRAHVQDNVIDYDRVSVHTSQTDSTEEDEQRTGEGGLIKGTDEDMTIEELRQSLVAERRREDEERANLMRQNNELREHNIRLQEQRSRSTTRSRSRSSRTTSRRSQSNRRDLRQEPPLGNISENIREDDDLQYRRNEYRIEQPPIDDRYVLHGENQQGERYQGEQNDPEQGRMILQGRQMLRDQREREAEVERNVVVQNHAQDEREMRRRRRQEIEEQKLQDVVRENNHDNRLRRREFNRIFPNQIMEGEEEQRRARLQEREMLRDRHDQVEEDEREIRRRRRRKRDAGGYTPK
ncbi:trichohyalin-like [Papaver somniferum]|uniref:trichohyalin-like n=1 Tax=Papaver somniferum TaxID=3469 RepID=UPI000E6F4EB4|nr:trichohyalin-like [Papaver somniferum]